VPGRRFPDALHGRHGGGCSSAHPGVDGAGDESDVKLPVDPCGIGDGFSLLQPVGGNVRANPDELGGALDQRRIGDVFRSRGLDEVLLEITPDRGGVGLAPQTADFT